MSPDLQKQCEELADKSAFICTRRTAFIKGFTACHDLMQSRIEELELKCEFIKKYLDPSDLRFRNMMDSFMSLYDTQKEKIIALSKSLADLSKTDKIMNEETVDHGNGD